MFSVIIKINYLVQICQICQQYRFSLHMLFQSKKCVFDFFHNEIS